MEEDEVRAITSPEELAQRLLQLADELEHISTASASAHARRVAPLYEPFLKVMGTSERLCAQLLSLGIDQHTPGDELRYRLVAFLMGYRLPHRGGYSIHHWLGILKRALFQVPGARGLPFEDVFEPEHGLPLELHFVFPDRGVLWRTQHPVAHVLDVDWPRQQSRTEYRSALAPVLKQSLIEFRRRVSRQWRLERTLRSGFSVTIATIEPHQPLVLSTGERSRISRVFRPHVIDSFSVSWKSGERIESLRNTVMDELLESLTSIDAFVVTQGRRTEAVTLAQHWQAHVLDRRTLEEIAEAEGYLGDDVFDRAETLARGFRRFGIE